MIPAKISSVVVPLDGSHLSERPLPIAAALAKSTEAQIRLVCAPVMSGFDAGWFATGMPEVPLGIPVEAVQRAQQECKADAEEYLGRKEKTLAGKGHRVQSVCKNQAPADLIVTTANRTPDSLIVMSTHGRSGLGRLAFGSVAENVLHRTTRPLLLMRAGDDEVRIPRSILVCLDGSPASETVLPIAATVGRALQAKLVIAHVLPDFSILQAAALGEKINVEVNYASWADSYLGEICDRLEACGCLCSVEKLSGDHASTAILERCEKGDIDMVALATHGYSGLHRLAYGSVAHRVLRQAACPVLIQPPESRIYHESD